MNSGLKIARDALDIIYKTEFHSAYSNILIQNWAEKNPSQIKQKGQLSHLVKGVIVWKKRLDWEIDQFIKKPVRLQNKIRILLQAGFYQIGLKKSRPDFAVVNELTELAKISGGRKAGNFVNGVLRNFLRNNASLVYPDFKKNPVKHISVFYSHPEWIVKRWIKDFGQEETIKLCEANNVTDFPVSIRANSKWTSEERLINDLMERGIDCSPVESFSNYIFIKSSESILGLPEYKKGMFSIQDPCMGIPVEMLLSSKTDILYDLCAAPGGKSLAIMEQKDNAAKLVSMDINPSRMRKIKTEAARLRLSGINYISADASEINFTKKGAVLVDVPCSGLGVIRKKTDIRWQKTETDLKVLSSLQKKILNNAAGIVRNGSFLVYCTCTLTKEENFDNVDYFLNKHKNFRLNTEYPEYLNKFIEDGCAVTYPHKHKLDGFFTAVFEKIKGM